MSDADDLEFENCVAEVLGEEGGYVNNPADPGGETKWGISKRAFPNVDIANLTREAASALYKTHYWDPLAQFNLSGLYKKVAFEAAINQGLTRVKPWLVAAEGQLDWFMAERALAYAALDTFKTFGKGWLRRLFKEVLP